MNDAEEVNGSHAATGRQLGGLDGSIGSKEERDMELKAINAEIRNLQLSLYGESGGSGLPDSGYEGLGKTNGGESRLPSAAPATEVRYKNTVEKGQNVRIDVSRFFSAADLPGEYETTSPVNRQHTTSYVNEMDSGGQSMVDHYHANDQPQFARESSKSSLQHKNSGERLYSAALDQQRRQAQKRQELIDSQNKRLQKLASTPTKLGKDAVRATVYRRRKPQQLYLNSGVSPMSSRSSSSSPRKTRIRRRSVDASDQLYRKAVQQQQKFEAKRESVEARRRASATPRLNRHSLEIAENIGGNVLDRLYTAPLARRRERLKAESSTHAIRAPVRSRSMSVDYKKSRSPESPQKGVRRASISGPVAGVARNAEKRFGPKCFSRTLEGNAEQECTFRPLLSRRSVKLLQSRKNENSVEDFLSRLEEDQNDRLLHKSTLSQRREQEELSPCTFYPTTTSRSPLKRGSPSANSTPSNTVSASSPPKRKVSVQEAEALYERQSTWREGIHARLEASRREREGEEQDECTFQPNIRSRRRITSQRRRRRSSLGSQGSSVVSERRDVSQHVARQMEARRIAEENRRAEFLRDIHPFHAQNDIQHVSSKRDWGSTGQSLLPDSTPLGMAPSHSPQELRYASNSATGTESTGSLSVSDRIARLTRARQDAERVSQNAEGLLNRQDSPLMDPQGSWSHIEHESTNGASSSGYGSFRPGSHIRDFLVGDVDAQLKSDEAS
eukprot:gb/GECG01013183.1/.p1 GENE.gb/GECG01013183.1/~~gb/GECG01013183.1/.p1  ORF type:complete len:728 (+),score=92.97 gb/GECG01013183.1/:1-2184(+)